MGSPDFGWKKSRYSGNGAGEPDYAGTRPERWLTADFPSTSDCGESPSGARSSAQGLPHKGVSQASSSASSPSSGTSA